MIVLKNRVYYLLKPFLPPSLRHRVRRWLALKTRSRVGAVWPILPGSERPPEGWPGWPQGKQFAFVITHDVEGLEGLERVRPLAEVEMKLGFRSCFNFIPEGDYQVPSELRQWLVSNGFEIGVHDLHHDGKLFKSREYFRECAQRINGYLKEWSAVGFRAGFMLRNLEWQHDLEVLYECSTFDTDPFEPLPDGVGTIFPFWLPNPHSGRRASVADGGPSLHTPDRAVRPGYVELPYTLPQDSTLFLLFREKTPDIWLRKLDWVAQHGGMALVNVHPDYLGFPGLPAPARSFPVEFYARLLEHVRDRYPKGYWQPLPREVGAFVLPHKETLRRELKAGRNLSANGSTGPKKPIWIDLENTPHIPFFKPIIRELEKRGYAVVLTARDAYQTCEMAERYGLPFIKVGRHYGKQKLWKVWGLFARAFRLLPFALRAKPCLALNHGSRTQNLVSNFLGIPTVTIMDYEHTAELRFLRPLWEITPSVIPEGSIPSQAGGGVLRYEGIKEDVYVPEFKPDPSILKQLGLDPGGLIVTVRPPATEAHYHNAEADALFERFMDRICATPGARAVVLPRNRRQEAHIRAGWPQWFADGKSIIPERVVEGLNLLWHSDLVVSGGGTMNREAAALRVPVYSIFRGQIGAVDRQLEVDGRLVMIETVEDVTTKIPLVRRPQNASMEPQSRKVLGEIVDHIEGILKSNS